MLHNTDNPAFVLRSIDTVVYEQRSVPELSENEVLVAIKKTGICGSDVRIVFV
ncbi:hypothetical protein JOM56_008492 [Amanita muscaria]